MAGKNGGIRPNSGRKKGYKSPTTLNKEQAREAVRLQIVRHHDAMTAAQIQNAMGLKYLVTRDKKTGKFVRVGPAMAGTLEAETVEIWEKDPSIQAYTDLMNRSIDKPKEQEQEIKITGLDIDARIRAATKRLKARKD